MKTRLRELYDKLVASLAENGITITLEAQQPDEGGFLLTVQDGLRLEANGDGYGLRPSEEEFYPKDFREAVSLLRMLEWAKRPHPPKFKPTLPPVADL